MTDTPRPIVTSDTPHPQIDADLRAQRELIARAANMDFGGCNVSTMVMALNEYDLAKLDKGELSHSIETWPADVKAKLRAEYERFAGVVGASQIAGVFMAISPPPRAFVLALHWRMKA